MIEAILELMFEFVIEVGIDLIASLFADATSRGVQTSVRRVKQNANSATPAADPASRRFARRRPTRADPMLKACAYVAGGWLLGMLSLWLVPQAMIHNYWLRLAYLVLAPLASGLVMSWIGSWRARHDKDVVGMETFAYGFCFAFTVSLVRFIWGAAG
jgi:hypothetical protein